MHNWFVSYLIDWYQRVIIDGASSDWRITESEVSSQGSVLGLLLFRIYINEISNDISSHFFVLLMTPYYLIKWFRPLFLLILIVI